MDENAVLSGGTCSTDDARGGNAFVIGTFNINGGTITNGAAGWGSNLMLQSGATINLNNGTITGGESTSGDDIAYGGNVYSSGTFTMNNGTIKGGTVDSNSTTAATYGGNIYSSFCR
jgi:hypothetical protein